MSDKEATEGRHFLEEIIDSDLASGRHQEVITRFPPEPNGYLHIGHAKSICLNFGLASQYGGRCHLRMDDTNPAKEDVEFAEAIKRDVRWLGFDWGEHLYHASDYFEQLFELAIGLIEDGKAYVCSLNEEEIRAYRGSVTSPGTASPYRERSVVDNLELFRRMRAGDFPDGAHVLRARIDMAASNMKMRDPLLYRIRHQHHDRTGDRWCIYPMYDFAHCLSDALEGITHSICTLEFENNRELYDWLVAETSVEATPRQYEFARLNLDYTMMSKRKLRALVEQGIVSGWDDPRMPTIAALRRRGVRPEAVRQFCQMIGIAKSNSRVDFQKLEFCIRDDLNPIAPRMMAVLDPLKVTLTNYDEDTKERFQAPLYPYDVDLEGERPLPFSKTLWIERGDFAEQPPKGFRRLTPGGEVKLRYAYIIKCEEVIKGPNGEVIELRCTFDPDSRGGEARDGRKVKGVIHWVDAETSIPIEANLYERLFSAENPEESPVGGSFLDQLTPDSMQRKPRARAEQHITTLDPSVRVQFERLGYFWQDPVSSEPGALVFNRIVALRDSWAKKKPTQPTSGKPSQGRDVQGQEELSSGNEAESKHRPSKRSRAEVRAANRRDDPRLMERFQHYTQRLGCSEADADVLSGDTLTARLFDEALACHPDIDAVVRWMVNDVLGLLKDGDEACQLTGAHIAAVIQMVQQDTLSRRAAKQVLEVIARQGGQPQEVVASLGLTQITDLDELSNRVKAVIEANTDKVTAYRAGRTSLMGFFIGQVMKDTGGRANPKAVSRLVKEQLDRSSA